MESIRGWSLIVVLGLIGALLVVVPGAARGDTVPPDPSLPVTAAADVLPTPQINGVVWTQVVAGNRVYVGGDFTTARPFGSPAGENEVPRSNLLAYDIETGALVADFAPVVNGQVLALTLSPDGTTLYVGGSFTIINGKSRSRLAAFNAATGAMKSNWRTAASTTVRSIAATSSTVYFGGDFASAANLPGQATVPRPFLAASSAATGELTPWTPAPDRYVRAVELTRDESKVVVGGHFQTIGGQTWLGLAALDPVTGAPLPWAASASIRDFGTNASITSLLSDAKGMLVTGYTFNGGGNFESVARLRESDGEITWISDCRGDTHSAFAQGDVVYTVSHTHRCANLPGGTFDERWPRVSPGGVSFTDFPTGVLKPETYGWNDWSGWPGPTALHFYPKWYFGTYTVSDQAAWNVTGNEKYLVFGGEFLGLNGINQQGLTRMARPDAAPNQQGPVTVAELTPTAASYKAGEAYVGWQETYDHDNARLTYQVYRNYTGAGDKPVYQVTSDSVWHDRGTLSFVDKGLTPGATYDYLVVASDPFGNRRASGRSAVTVVSSSKDTAYGQVVLQDKPDHYYRFTGTATSLTDSAGSDPAVSSTGVGLAADSPIADAKDTSGVLDGTTFAFSASQNQNPAPNVLSVEAWVRTADADGGRIAGFSTAYMGASSWTDKQLYLDTAGNIAFGVDSAGLTKVAVATSGRKYNDDQWHHVVGTLSAEGMRLYVDGVLVGSDPSVTEGRRISGTWRIGRDAMTGWPGAPSAGLLQGRVDEVAVYGRALTADQVQSHFAARTGESGLPANVPPQAAFTMGFDGRKVSFDAAGSSDPDGSILSYDWSFGDGGTATGKAVTWTYTADGTYPVTLTVTDDRGGSTSITRDVVLNPAQLLASDTFERTSLLGGWGTADLGGAWTTCSRCQAAAGAGQMVLRASDNPSTLLSAVTGTSTDVTVQAVLDKTPTGSGTFLSVVPRGSGRDGYRARLTVSSTGAVTATLQRAVGTSTVNLGSVPVSGLIVRPGGAIMLRAQAVGTAPTTLRFKVWDAAAAEPTDWTLVRTDADPSWQKAGAPGLWAFASSNTSNGPITVSWDNLKVQTAR